MSAAHSFSAGIAPGFRGIGTGWRWLCGHFLTDGSFAVCYDKLMQVDDPRWRPTPFVQTYADGPAGRPFLLWGSAGRLEIALDRGAAAARLSLRVGDPVRFVARRRSTRP